MGNYFLACNEPKIEEKEILKSNKRIKQNYLDGFIMSLKPINKYENKKRILKPKLTKKLRKEIKII